MSQVTCAKESMVAGCEQGPATTPDTQLRSLKGVSRTVLDEVALWGTRPAFARWAERQ